MQFTHVFHPTNNAQRLPLRFVQILRAGSGPVGLNFFDSILYRIDCR